MASALRTLIVDDEPRARAGLRSLLAVEPDLEVVGECGDGASALLAIESLEPDLLLLDIEMPEMGGLEVLRVLGSRPGAPLVVIVTAYDSYALQAFDGAALDYLLKPFSDERLHRTVLRAREVIEGRRAEQINRQLLTLLERARGETRPPAAAAASGVRTLAVSQGGDTWFVPVSRVDWIEAQGFYVRLHVGAAQHLLRGHLGYFERTLPAESFCRISRSAMVNLSRVKRLRDGFKGAAVVELEDGTRIPVSRTRRKAFERALRGDGA
jgi:two-component system LytT family response regulator